jgi:hypothetical protein
MVTHAAQQRCPARAALHTGECEFSPDGMPLGYNVELTRKILSVTTANTVMVSRVVKDLVAGSGIQFRPSSVSIEYTSDLWPLFEVVSC